MSLRPAATSLPVPRVRVPRLDYGAVDRHWFGGIRAATHISNAVNLLFPAGERFFVRSVRHYLDRVTPELAAQVKGFFGQEGRHAQAHERFFDTLRAQGLAIDPILERYEHIAFERIEKRSPPKLRLAVTAACEHFTAIMAEDALTSNDLAVAHPEIRRLFEWHAVEELEHKAVAFDVLKQIAPSYLLRIVGLVVAAVLLGGFWIWATARLLEQEGSSLREAAKELSALEKDGMGTRESIASGVFLRGIREYLRPGFHPNDRDHRALIATTLARLESEGVVGPESLLSSSAQAAA
jgi:predicted metal-dependent hydrolase